MSPEQIWIAQNDPNSQQKIIYGSGVFNDILNFKLYAYNQIKPEIIALGSSRVLQFRRSFFSRPFYNLGSVISSVNDLMDLAKSETLDNSTKIILLGIDFWWFNKKLYKEQCSPRLKKPNKPSVKHLVLPFRWIQQRKITFNQYKKYIFQKSNHIGIKAELLNSGMALDGSYYYTDLITGKSISDEGFRRTIDNIRNNRNRFEHDTVASDVLLNMFLKAVNIFSKKHVKVILFFPPLPDLVNKEMEKFNFNYIQNLKKKLAAKKISIYDFTSSESLLDTNDCEFIDGFHGGDILYAKILHYISKQEPILKPYVNKKYLNFISLNYNNFAMIPDSTVTIEKEIDFLRFKCEKKMIQSQGSSENLTGWPLTNNSPSRNKACI